MTMRDRRGCSIWTRQGKECRDIPCSFSLFGSTREMLARGTTAGATGLEDIDHLLLPGAFLFVETIHNTIVANSWYLYSRIFDDTKKLHRHARTSYPGAVENPARQSGHPCRGPRGA
jgi:hypothetical protein